MSRKTAIACFAALLMLAGCIFFASGSCSKLMGKIGLAHLYEAQEIIVAENTAEIADAIREAIGMYEYVSLDNSHIVTHFGFRTEVLSDSTVYTSTKQNDADEIAVFKLSDVNKSDEVMSAISERLDLKAKTFDVLNSYEYDKIENTLFLNKGEYVILVTTAKINSAWAAIESFYQSETAAVK